MASRRHHVAGLVTLVAVVAAACTSGQASSDIDVRPIDEILATDVDVAPDPSGSVATLTVETDVPVACAVIYGPDEDFGAVAVDQDMDGGAHREHAPMLTGLEPATEYQFVLQGSDTAGTLYRSETMTFTTPQAADAPAGTNMATGAAVAGVSSEFSEGFAAEQAIDGDLGTAWATAGDGDDAWIEIDLGETVDIDTVRLRSRSMTDGTSIIDTYTVTVDGADALGPFDAGDDAAGLVDVATSGQRLRFDAVTTTGGNTGAVEVEIYAGA
jgi:hypothetical protein